MSRAYCLTCNEQVMVTASGTCTSGHPVATHDAGPEPWIGRASTDDDTISVERTSEPGLERTSEPVTERGSELAEVDVAELQELHHVGAGIGSGRGNGHVGAANGYATEGHSPNGHVANGHVDRASAEPVTRHPANSQVSDELAAMLAEAFNSEGDGEATTEQESEDWGDLATLAAELELDGSSAQAEAPVDVPTAPEPPSAPEPVQSPAPPPPPATERAVPPPPEPTAVPEVDPWTDEPDVTPPSDEDLSSGPSADDGADDVPEDAPATEPASTSSVDPTNFTARGARVGTNGRSARKLFGRKR